MKWMALMMVAGTAIFAAGCGSEQEKQKPGTTASGGEESVSLVLNWFPEMEHGGFYAAQVNDLYKKAGLDVTIVPGGVDVPVVALVATGRNQFGVANADDLIMGRAEGADLVALFAPMQDSPRVIMVHEASGIRTLSDLKDMTLAMGIGSGFGAFVQKKYPLENVTIVPYPGSISVFLENKDFAQQAYSISEPFVAKKNGGDPHNIFVSEYGYNPYTSLLVVSRDYLEKNRDTVRRMVKASLEGWDLYMKDPTRTNEHINKQNPEMGMDILAFGVGEMQGLVYTADAKASGLGTMTEARWTQMVSVMEEVNLIKKGAVNPRECFTTEFLGAPR
ncbi:myristoyl transferase [bacterium]|nr:myristoyl transferase [bacterium]